MENGKILDSGELSSGEQILLALSALLMGVEDGRSSPKLFLMDEIDASLHPSLVGAMLEVINTVIVKNDCCAVFATHSPATVSIFPEESLYEVVRGQDKEKVRKISRVEAVSKLTEGYFSLEQASQLVSHVTGSGVWIITEGKNSQHINRALGILGSGNFHMLPGMEHCTGAEQLRTLYDFLVAIRLPTPCLIVWDCDYKKMPAASGNVYTFQFQNNTSNEICKTGIENIYPKDVVEKFCSITESFDGRRRTVNFGSDAKRPLLDYVLSTPDEDLFAGYAPLAEEIRRIQSISVKR